MSFPLGSHIKMVARSECHGHMEICGRGGCTLLSGYLESYARWAVTSWQGQLGSMLAKGDVGPPKLERLKSCKQIKSSSWSSRLWVGHTAKLTWPHKTKKNFRKDEKFNACYFKSLL